MPLAATAAFLLIAQVGPNPALESAPIIPEELREQRRRNAIQARDAESAQRSRLAECLALVAESERRGVEFARAWRERAGPEDAAQATHCLGFSHVRAGRFGEAQAAFATALTEAPDDNLAYRARLGGMAGNAAMAGGEASAAEGFFAQAVGEARQASDAGLAAGLSVDHARALVALSRDEAAADALSTARTLNPGSARAWLLSATLSRRMGQLAEAQSQIEQAADLNDQNPAIALEAGVIAALSGRRNDARRSFESILILAPDSSEADRATAYLAQLGEIGSDTSTDPVQQ